MLQNNLNISSFMMMVFMKNQTISYNFLFWARKKIKIVISSEQNELECLCMFEWHEYMSGKNKRMKHYN